MFISAPKTALVFQPCIDAQMAARGISRSPKSAVTGLDFSPRCSSKYLWLRFNASFPFPSLKQENVLEVWIEPCHPALLSAALHGLRCHPWSKAQCRWYTGGTTLDARRQHRVVPWAPATFNEAKQQTQKRAAARRNCLKLLQQQRPSWRVHFLSRSVAAAPESQDPLIAIEQGFPFLVRAQT